MKTTSKGHENMHYDILELEVKGRAIKVSDITASKVQPHCGPGELLLQMDYQEYLNVKELAGDDLPGYVIELIRKDRGEKLRKDIYRRQSERGELI